jgi:predicted TIM-barrel fold metal-dependent hydrolase
MSAIAASRSAAGTPVHPFLAFDPWRCLRDRQRGNDPLAEIKRALSEGRGIGIKLYPPMGFAAAGNANRSADDFPLELRKLAGNPGRSVDGVLDELFDYCADNDVPVMAHCGQSNGSAKQYETLADPLFWQQALDGPRPRRKQLRLNLGHFGGIWEMGVIDTQQRRWATTILELMNT